jgi:hypothetical protein
MKFFLTLLKRSKFTTITCKISLRSQWKYSTFSLSLFLSHSLTLDQELVWDHEKNNNKKKSAKLSFTFLLPFWNFNIWKMHILCYFSIQTLLIARYFESFILPRMRRRETLTKLSVLCKFLMVGNDVYRKDKVQQAFLRSKELTNFFLNEINIDGGAKGKAQKLTS